MSLHVHYGRQATVDSETRRRKFPCLERLVVVFFGNRNARNTEEENGAFSGITDVSDSKDLGEVSEIVIEGDPIQHLELMLRSISSPNQFGQIQGHRHILEYINTDGPGKEMGIKEGDEILMLNNKFVPAMTHKNVMTMLSELKVDGQSTVELMIRRKKSSGKWKWLELSVILAPCKCLDKDTTVKKLKSTRVKKNRKKFVNDHVYKIQGTQQYLQIDDNGLSTDTLSLDDSDKTKVIQKNTVMYQQVDGTVDFMYEVALCDKELNRYIRFCPVTKKIVLSETPQWFQYSQFGDETHLRSNGYYLGYNHDANEVTPQKEKCAFEELPVPDHLKDLSF